jgi:hypothetical protein
VSIVRRPEVILEIEKLGVDFVGVESPEISEQIQIAAGEMPISLGLDAVGGSYWISTTKTRTCHKFVTGFLAK